MRRLLVIALLAAPVLGSAASVPSVQVTDDDCYYIDATVGTYGGEVHSCPQGVSVHITPPPL